MDTTKVAIITGSSSGIGEATAKLFLQNGYQVVITGSSREKLDRVVESCKGLSPKGLEPFAIVADFRRPENVDIILEKTLEKFARLDVLVNNAGSYIQCAVADKNSYDSYRETMTINLDSAVRLSLASIEHLKKTKGNIVNVASVGSLRPLNKGAFAYCASKSGMSMLAKCLAVDLAPDIRVNTVLPGPVATQIMDRVGLPADTLNMFGKALTLVKRVGQSDEIAKLIAFLASDDAAYITGADIPIDGGFVLKPNELVMPRQKA